MSQIKIGIVKSPNFKMGNQRLDMYVPQLVRAAARQAMVVSKHKVPVLTGRLQGSHYMMYTGKVGNVYTAIVSAPAANPRSGDRYGGYVHFGTRFQRAQPWMQEAIDELEQNNPETYIAQDVNELMRVIRAGLAAQF